MYFYRVQFPAILFFELLKRFLFLEDDSDDEDFNAFLPDVYEGMKHRMNVINNGKVEPKEPGTNPEEDPLKWVEENIPETVENENPLPVLDSEDELETTRFELSKMQ